MSNCSNVKNLRISKGWSQEHLAEVSGLNVRTIQRLERGENASLETLSSLCSVLLVKAEELTCDVMTEPKDQNEAVAVNEKLDLDRVREQISEEVSLFRKFLRFLLVVMVVITVHFYTLPNESLWFVWPFLIWGGLLVSRFLWLFMLKTKVEKWRGDRVKTLLK